MRESPAAATQAGEAGVVLSSHRLCRHVSSGHETTPGRSAHGRGVALVVGCAYRAGGFSGRTQDGQAAFCRGLMSPVLSVAAPATAPGCADEHGSVGVDSPACAPPWRREGERSCERSASTCTATSARWRSARADACARRGACPRPRSSSSCSGSASPPATRWPWRRPATRSPSRASSRRTWRASWWRARVSCTRSRAPRPRPTASMRAP